MPHRIKAYLRTNFEAIFWVAALLVLFFMPAAGSGVTLCPFHWLGLRWCPGCGVGHAIHYALHFQFADSFRSHPAGIPGVIIILLRIKQLVYPKKAFIYDQR